MTVTPYADLDALLDELVGHWRRILGDNLVGAYVQGSFALGAGDQHSDCDFIVATHERPSAEQEAALRALHDEIPTREGHWPHDIEGSYAPIDELATVDALGRPWLFNNHGHRGRWSGTTTATGPSSGGSCASTASPSIGPDARSFVEPVPAEAIRREAAAAIPTLMADLATWLDIDTIAWGQRYAVVTACRILYTLDTAEVASKAGALEWAQRRLDPRWRPLLAQVRDDRAMGCVPGQPPRPGSADAARRVRGVRSDLGGGAPLASEDGHRPARPRPGLGRRGPRPADPSRARGAHRGRRQPTTSRTASTARWSSARPASGVRWAPGPTG